MPVLPPNKCDHGIDRDRLVPCGRCHPEAKVASHPDVDSRLRRLETEFAYYQRPIVAAGFCVVVPAAVGEQPGRAEEVYLPIEAEWFHGLSIVPDDHIVLDAQSGRLHFFDRATPSSADLRRLGVRFDEKGVATIHKIFPASGVVLHFQNDSISHIVVRGAFLIERMPFEPYPPSPTALKGYI